ncbi:MAG: hypothetical protein U5L04_11275, partial [Trueperaceae bacterium]|nr:hypothetical protein [Trueperaceae bacterium]
HDTDRAQRQPSIARSHPAVSGYLGRATLGLAVLAAGLALILPETTFWAMLALSALGLAGLGYTEERLTTTALRVLGDAVLLTPLVPLVGWLLAGWLGG